MKEDPYFSRFDYSVPLAMFLFCLETILILIGGTLELYKKTKYELKQDWKEIKRG